MLHRESGKVFIDTRSREYSSPDSSRFGGRRQGLASNAAAIPPPPALPARSPTLFVLRICGIRLHVQLLPISHVTKTLAAPPLARITSQSHADLKQLLASSEALSQLSIIKYS